MFLVVNSKYIIHWKPRLSDPMCIYAMAFPEGQHLDLHRCPGNCQLCYTGLQVTTWHRKDTIAGPTRQALSPSSTHLSRNLNYKAHSSASYGRTGSQLFVVPDEPCSSSNLLSKFFRFTKVFHGSIHSAWLHIQCTILFFFFALTHSLPQNVAYLLYIYYNFFCLYIIFQHFVPCHKDYFIHDILRHVWSQKVVSMYLMERKDVLIR